MGMRVGREGDELVLGTWKDIWEHIKKVLLDHQTKERRDIHEKKDAK